MWQRRCMCWIVTALLWLGVWQACLTALALLHHDFDHISQYAGDNLWGSSSFSCIRNNVARLPRGTRSFKALARSFISQHRYSNPSRRAWPPGVAAKVVAGSLAFGFGMGFGLPVDDLFRDVLYDSLHARGRDARAAQC